MSADDLLVVAGEASGDLHGARLLAELAEIAPEVRPFGLGGDEMAAVRFDGAPLGDAEARTFDAVAHCSEIAVVGITEALRILPRAWNIFQLLLAEVDRRGAKTAVLIDAPDFNLRLAKKLRRRGVRVLYYISPQVWAWRKGRIKQIVRDVDRMLVLFPFEVDFYRQHGVEVVHVGHPLIDEVPRLPQAWEQPPPRSDEPYVISLLPGSRASEVRALLPTMLESVRLLSQQTSVRVRLIQAPTVEPALIDGIIQSDQIQSDQIQSDQIQSDQTVLPLERVTEDRFQAIAASHLALCASGTATLEVGLLGTPQIVLYRLQLGSYILARLLLDLEHFSMVNLVLGRGAVPELAQKNAEPEPIAREARRLLENPEEIETLRASMAELRPRLGAGGASLRAAREVAEQLAIASRELASRELASREMAV